MSKIGELVSSIGLVMDKTGEAATAISSATRETEAISDAAEALGTQALVGTLGRVKEQLGQLAQRLNVLSQQANDIRAQVLGLSGDGSRAGGTSTLAPGTSPSHVPTASSNRDKTPPTGAKSRLRKLTARAIKMGEDVSDAADVGKEVVQRIDNSILKAPEPPPVTATSGRAPNSPPTISTAPGPGIEAGTVATAGLAVGVFIVGTREVVRKLRLKRPSQEPDDPPR